MWTRSQDKKKLVDAKIFTIKFSNRYRTWRVKGYGSGYDFKGYLGEYSTKEKAMKVLGMIEKQINTIGVLKTFKIAENIHYELQYNQKIATHCNVFQMPQESEVE